MSINRLALAFVMLFSTRALAGPCPNVMLVIDRTGSMDMSLGGSSQSLWEITQAAVSTILSTKIAGMQVTYGDQLSWGLELFCAESSGADPDAACYADTKIDVHPAHDTASTITSIVNAAETCGWTNTGEAIKRAAVDVPMKDTTRGQYIVLITDGDPNCNSNDGSDATYTISEITGAAKQSPSIHTFVIGFTGTGVSSLNLNRMAVAGLEPRTGCNTAATSDAQASANPCYYDASDPTKLNQALDAIIKKVSGGEFGQGLCDDSCFANGCPQGQRCAADEISGKPTCVVDPCAGVAANCAVDEFCREGNCVPICPTACKTNEMCVDGSCIKNPCANTSCGTDSVCDPQTGGCVVSKCDTAKPCGSGKVCEPVTGDCITDECLIIVCPTGTICRSGGNCEATIGGTTPTIRPRSGVGCSTTRMGDVSGVVLAALLLLGLALIERRRISR